MLAHPALARARELAAPTTAEARASGDVATETAAPSSSAEVWEYLVARDATARSLLGPATSEGEAAAVRRQIEALTDRAGFTHWWDPQLARAWVDRAVALTGDEERARLDAAGYEEQLRAVREIWGALSGAYRALNLSWTVDPAAREAYTSRTNGADSRQWCDSGAWGLAAERLTPGPYIGTADGGRGCVRTHVRIALDTNSDVQDFLRAEELDRDRWPAWGVLPSGRLNVFDWHAFAWHYTCATRTGIECERWTSEFFPPLIWSFELAREIARSLQRRGPLRVVAEAARAAFVLNVRAAFEAGVLSQVVGDAAANRLAGLASVQLAEAHVPDDTADAVSAGIAGAAPVVAAIPGVGLVAAALMGVASAAVAAFNRLFALVRPVQRDLDAWGRDRPVMERTYLTGAVTRADHPTHSVPAPPGWSRPLTFPVLGYIPTREVIEAAKGAEAARGGEGGGAAHGATRAPAKGVPAAVVTLGLVAVLGLVALATRERWADEVREVRAW